MDLAQDVWVAPGAEVVGDVRIGAQGSVWFSARVSGEEARVDLDQNVNVQDNCVVAGVAGHPVWIGAGTSLGHNAQVWGAHVEASCLIAIGSIVRAGAVIREHSIVAANAEVPEGMDVPPRSLVIGHGRILRQVTDGEVERIQHGEHEYVRLGREYLATQRARAGS